MYPFIVCDVGRQTQGRKAMSAMNKLDAAVSSRTVILSVILIVGLATGAVFLVMHLLTGGGSGAVAVTPHKPQVAHQVKDVAEQSADSTDVASAGIPDYQIIATRNLIQSSTKPTTKPVITPSSVLPPGGLAGGMGIRPFTIPFERTLAYTGTVGLPSGTYILLQNVVTKRSQYTQVGGMAFGYKVIDATANTVTLDHDGTPVTFNLGENKVEDRGASTATAAPVANGAPPGAPANPMAGGTPGGLPNIQIGGNNQNFGGGGGRRNRNRQQPSGG
jgi:hypothetical protein